MTRALIAALLLFPAVSVAECLTQPLKAMTVTSNYGMRYHPKFQVWRPHNGADFRAPMLTEVFAAHPGTVSHGGWMGGGGGNTVVLKGNSLETRYLHMSKVEVASGEQIAAGKKIGLSGNTGHASTAPHLHFEVREDGGSAPRDPRGFLCPKPGEVAGAGPESPGQVGSQPPSGSVTAVPKTAPSGAQTMAQVASAQGENFALDAEWKKQVYEITHPMTAYELLADLWAKRLAAKARIAAARERLSTSYGVHMAAELQDDAGQLRAAREAAVRDAARR